MMLCPSTPARVRFQGGRACWVWAAIALFVMGLTAAGLPDEPEAAPSISLQAEVDGLRAALLTILPRCEQGSYPELAMSSAESITFELSALRILTADNCAPPRVDQLLGQLVALGSCESARELPVCGPAATCGSTLITLGDATQLSSTRCHCGGNTYPFPTALSATSSPYDYNYGEP